MSLRRRPHPKPSRKPVLIVCEGYLETTYFNVLQRHPNVQNRFALNIYCAHGGGHRNVVNEAKNRARTFGQGASIWCIFDVEHDPQCPQLQQSLRTCQENGFKVGLSNPCFDAWIVAHRKQVAIGSRTPGDFKKLLGSVAGGTLDVRDTSWILEHIMGGEAFPNIQMAVNNIPWFSSRETDQIRGSNPSTSVGELVGMLTDL